MEGLVHRASLHVEPIGKQVEAGHYDLMGPSGEIILPQIWETMIKPGMSISMHMWPPPEPKKKSSRSVTTYQISPDLALHMGSLVPKQKTISSVPPPPPVLSQTGLPVPIPPP